MTLRRIPSLLALLFGLWSCMPDVQPTPTETAPAPTFTLAPSLTPSPVPPTATPTPPACLSEPGTLSAGTVGTTVPPQGYLVYLPHCYDQLTALRYPVLYLLHGQTYTDDEWVRLGAVDAADRLILSGEAAPFIMVFPDDRYWNLEAGPGFGVRLVEALIPFIDENYRTLALREDRAVGGLSRGGGWGVRLGLTRWDLFGTLGLHSPAIFSDDSRLLEKWIAAVPDESWPRLWLDAGDRDKELGSIRLLEDALSRHEIPHEFHLYAGDHSEAYWSAHVEEYLRWYVEDWVQR